MQPDGLHESTSQCGFASLKPHLVGTSFLRAQRLQKKVQNRSNFFHVFGRAIGYNNQLSLQSISKQSYKSGVSNSNGFKGLHAFRFRSKFRRRSRG